MYQIQKSLQFSQDKKSTVFYTAEQENFYRTVMKINDYIMKQMIPATNYLQLNSVRENSS